MPNDTASPAQGRSSNNISGHGSSGVNSTSASNDTSLVINATMTAQPSTGHDGGPGLPGGVIALLLCLLLVGVAVLCIIFYLKRTGKLYKMIPFKPLINPRRSSFSSSERALHVDTPESADPGDQSQMDELTRRREAGMFTIEDHDMDSVDIDATSRGTNDDSEYFYDEVFGKSMFEDEATNASMRHLYLASDEAEEEMLDVDAIVDSITGKTSKPTKT